MMKRCISLLLVFFLLGACSVTAFAKEGSETEDNFSIEELPAFGEELEPVFTEVVPPPAETSNEPTAEPAESESVTVQPETQTEPAETSTEPAEDASPAAPETEPEASGNNNLPAIIAAAALAIGAAAIYLIKKHKHVEPHRGDGK